ncbi:MAG TPA: calcium-binding protein [Solirubrobacterales bacterium]|nr:calcium-binding protein [Solirubrobacterales bacterium]
MLTKTPAHSNKRARRALIAAALAACAVPAGAQAATVEMSADGTTLIHRGAAGEINSLNVRVVDGAVEVKDFAGLTSRTPLCSSVTSATVRCAIGLPKRIHTLLGDRNDGTSIRVGIPVIVEGGTGDDSFTAGNGPDPSNIAYHGGFGRDTVTYRFADRGVRVNASSFFTADGRKGIDQDNVMDDVDVIQGSEFDDELVDFTLDSDIGPKTIVGRQGNDVLRSGLGDHGVTFDMGSARDGADTIVAGDADYTLVDYSKRTQPLTVTLDHGNGNDGEPGEGDTITGPVAQVLGGQAGDLIRARPDATDGSFILGGPGDDTLEGADGDDDLRGDAGADTLLGNGGGDILHADDGFRDIVGCGSGIDTALLDAIDGFTSCENRTVGVLRLAPKTIRAQSGEPVRLRLGWSHPRAWKQLRSIELHLTQRGAPVGEVTIRPRAKRISGDGAVELVRKHTRLTRKGKTVNAHLALRLDPGLAGRTLGLAVTADDVHGARQVVSRAATISLAR